MSGIPLFGTTIEIVTIVGFCLLTLFGLAAYFKKITPGIAFFSGVAGFGIAWIFAPYNNVIVTSLGNCLWYGYAWNLTATLGLLHMILIIIAVCEAGYSLWKSDGKVIWP